MDEILTRWAADLNKYQKQFQQQAEQVAKWDRLLVDNTQKISNLYAKTFQAERDAAEVERQLTHIENQQEELEQWLQRYEGEVEEMVQRVAPGDGVGVPGSGVDLERERTYRLAERLNGRLDELNRDLTDVIDEINAVGTMLSRSKGDDDPVSHSSKLSTSLLTLEISSRMLCAY
jgi:nuclear pore complex protein Nup62